MLVSVSGSPRSSVGIGSTEEVVSHYFGVTSRKSVSSSGAPISQQLVSELVGQGPLLGGVFGECRALIVVGAVVGRRRALTLLGVALSGAKERLCRRSQSGTVKERWSRTKRR